MLFRQMSDLSKVFSVPLVDLAFRQPDVLTSGGASSHIHLFSLNRTNPITCPLSLLANRQLLTANCQLLSTH
jgi:hypothetical protein